MDYTGMTGGGATPAPKIGDPWFAALPLRDQMTYFQNVAAGWAQPFQYPKERLPATEFYLDQYDAIASGQQWGGMSGKERQDYSEYLREQERRRADENSTSRKINEGVRDFTQGAWDNYMKYTPPGLLAQGAEWLSKQESMPEWLRNSAAEGSDYMRRGSMSVIGGLGQTVGSVANLVEGTEYDTDPWRGTKNVGNANTPIIGGTGAMIGDMVDDIALGIGAGVGLAKWGAQGAANIVANGGNLGKFGQLLWGAAKPITIAGRTVAPAATWGARGSMGVASSLTSLYSGLPALSEGEITPGQYFAQAAIEGAGGAVSAGVWGGKWFTNVLGDVAANLATSAVSGAVPLAFGQKGYGWDEYKANLALGAGLGTAFAMAGNVGGAGVDNPTIAPGAKYNPDARRPATGRTVDQVQADIAAPYRDAEQILYGGQSTPEQVAPKNALDALVARKGEGLDPLQTLSKDPETGAVRSFSDAMLTSPDATANVDNITARQAAAQERQVYAEALVSMYGDDVLIPLLKLNAVPGTLTREQLIDRIDNEWLVQASNGMGISGVESVLQSAQLMTPLDIKNSAQAQADSPVVAEMRPAAEADIEQSPLTGGEAPTAGYINAVSETRDWRGRPIETPMAERPAPTPVSHEAMDDTMYGGRVKTYKSPDGKLSPMLIDEDGYATVPNDDLLTTPPPTLLQTPEMADRVAPLWKRGGADGARAQGKDRPEEILAVRDPNTGNIHVVDGVRHVEGFRDGFFREGMVTSVDPTTGRMVDTDAEGAFPNVVNRGGLTKVRLMDWDTPEGVLDARLARNPELAPAREGIAMTAMDGDATPGAEPTRTEVERVTEAVDGDLASMDSPLADNTPVEPEVVETAAGTMEAARVLESYAGEHVGDPDRGVPIETAGTNATSSREIARRTKWYEGQKPWSERTERAQKQIAKGYEWLASETRAQFQKLVDEGYRFNFVDEAHPYATHEDFLAALEAKSIDVPRAILPDDHPLNVSARALTGYDVSMADVLTATNYVFGHGAASADFTIEGIEKAWAAQARAMKASAWPALATEMRIHRTAEAVGKAVERNPALAEPNMSKPPGADISTRELAEASVVSGDGNSIATRIAAAGENPMKAPMRVDSKAPAVERGASAWYEAMDLRERAVAKRLENGTLTPNQAAEEMRAYVKSLSSFLAGDAPLELKFAKGARRISDEITLVARAEGLPNAELARQIIDGRTSALDGMVKTSYDADRGVVILEMMPGKYTPEDIGNAVARRVESNAEITVNDSGRRIVRRKSETADPIARDTEEIIAGASEQGAVKSSIDESTAALMEMARATSGEDNIVGMNISGTKAERTAAHSKATRAINQFVDTIVADATQKGVALNPQAVRVRALTYALAGEAEATGILDELNARFGDEIDQVDAFIREASEANQGGKHTLTGVGGAVVKMLETSGSHDFAANEMARGFRKSMLRADDARLTMEQVSKMTGIDPRMLIDLADQQHKSKVSGLFTDAEMIEAAAKLNADGNEEANRLFLEGASQWMSVQATAAYGQLRNANMFGKGKDYNWSQRAFSSLASTALLYPAWDMLNDQVATMEDDETYLGISGRAWKSAMSNGSGLALAGFFGFAKPRGTTTGRGGQRYRANDSSLKFMANKMRNAWDGNTVDMSKKSPAELKQYAEGILAEKGMKRNSPEWDNEVARITTLHRETGKTVKTPEQGIAGIAYMSKVYPWVGDRINAAYETAQLYARNMSVVKKNILQKVQDIHSMPGRGERIVDAVVQNDYRMSEVAILEGVAGSKPDVIEAQRERVREQIKSEFFTRKDGTLNEAEYAEYTKLQALMDPLRELHLRALVAKGLGKHETELERFREELSAEKVGLETILGSIQPAYKDLVAARAVLNEQKKSLAGDMRRADDNIDVSQFESLRSQNTFIDELDAQIRAAEFQIEATKANIEEVNERIGRIDGLPALIAKSKRDGYIPHIRDQYAPWVMRVTDAASGYNVRLEAQDQKTANMLKEDKMRDVAYRRGMENAFDATWEETIRFLDSGEKVYGTVYENTKSKNKTIERKAARQAVEAALSAGGFMTGHRAVRTVFEADGKMSLDDLVNEIDALNDFASDLDSIRRALTDESNGDPIYKQTKSRDAETGVTREVVNIDLVELRRIASRFMEPPIPSLARRHNVEGYYNPNGNWSAGRKWKFLTDGLETMETDAITSGQKTIVRESVQKMVDDLDGAGVANGLRQWLQTYMDGVSGTLYPHSTNTMLMKGAYVLRNIIGATNLVLNLTSGLANSIYGRVLLGMTHGQERAVAHGARLVNDMGQTQKTEWFRSRSEAEDFIRTAQEAKAEKGMVWIPAEKAAWGKLMSPVAIGKSLAMITAPRTALGIMARMDPRYAVLRDQIERLNLREASVTGSIGDLGFEVSRTKRWSKGAIWMVTRHVEESNNLAAALVFADEAFGNYGLTVRDFDALNQVQQTDAMRRVLRRTRDGIEAIHAIDALQSEGADIAALSKADPTSLSDKQRAAIGALKKAESIAYDEVMKEAIRGRRQTQGGFSTLDQTRIERWLRSNPAGVASLTLSVPALRAAEATAALVASAAHADGISLKMAKMAPVIAGTAILTTLLGAAAAPIAGDVALFGELGMAIWDAMTGDDKRVQELSKRQRWEQWGADIFEAAGYKREQGEQFVQMMWTEGLIKYLSGFSVGNEGSLVGLGILPGIQILTSTAQNWGRGLGDVWKMFSGELSPGNVAYRNAKLLGTQSGRMVQGVTQAIGERKLTPYGDAMIDPRTGKYIPFTFSDSFRHILAGRPWREVRSTLTAYEGGVPLYTDEDKHNYAMSVLKPTQFIAFGGGKRLPSEELVLSRVAKDAKEIDHLRQTVWQRNNYDRILGAKTRELDDMIDGDAALDLPASLGGRTTVSHMLGVVGQKLQYDYSGRGTPSARKAVLKDVRDYYVSHATAETMQEMYGGKIPLRPTNKWFVRAEDGMQFALYRLVERYARATGKLEETTRGAGMD